MLNRRRALQLLVALSFSAAAPAALACRLTIDGVDSDAIRLLGQEYLASANHDDEVDKVVALIMEAGENVAVEMLAGQMSADFSAGRIVVLSGWFVSTTEARLYAALSRCA